MHNINDRWTNAGKRAGSGQWGLPCGYIEYGENFVDTAIREVKEEIGIDSEPLKIINVVSNSLFSKISSVVIVILSKPLSLELTADGVETIDAQWFDVGSLPKLVGSGFHARPLENPKQPLTELSDIGVEIKKSIEYVHNND